MFINHEIGVLMHFCFFPSQKEIDKTKLFPEYFNVNILPGASRVGEFLRKLGRGRGCLG